MVNWHHTTTQLFCIHVAAFLADVATGVYLWEFSTCFKFDWSFFARRRPFRWTVIPYLIARYTCAAVFVVYIYTANVFWSIKSCRVWWASLFALAHVSLAASSLLLIVRVIAISENSQWKRAVLGCLWLAEAGASIHSELPAHDTNI
ncbi:hypothetical protein AURDEDRAFT_179917, partial [Auricularia subglabra TFB-10046 SS5]